MSTAFIDKELHMVRARINRCSELVKVIERKRSWSPVSRAMSIAEYMLEADAWRIVYQKMEACNDLAEALK